MEENFSYQIIKNLATTIEKTVLIVGQETATNKQIHKRVSEIAYLLKEENGLKVGQKVLIASSPNVEFYCIALAVWAIGGVIIILDPSMTFDRINHCIDITKPSFFVYPNGSKLKYLKHIFPAVRAIPNSVELESPSSVVPLIKPSDVMAAKTALITFTTGTTGMPKQLVRMHSYMLEQSASATFTYNKMAAEFNIHTKECDNPVMTNLPVFPLHSLRIGVLVAIVTKFIKCDPAVVINTIKQHGISLVIGSPAFLAQLSTYASKHDIILPVAGVGGAPVYRSTVRLIASTVLDKKLAIIYGATEAEPISVIAATEKMALEESKPDGLCVGRPAFEDTVKIIPASDDPIDDVIDVNELELPPGEIGEIILSGTHVNTKQADKKRLINAKDGTVWLRIEDGGYRDKDGRIWLTGRVKWRAHNKKTGVTHWPTVIEQKILERTSLITFAVYIPRAGKVYLFLEAPNGLPEHEFQGIKSFIEREGIPVDELVVKEHIKKDRRHASKPDTNALFASKTGSSINYVYNSIWFILSNNYHILMIFIVCILFCLFMISYLIFF